jgi:protein MpaA
VNLTGDGPRNTAVFEIFLSAVAFSFPLQSQPQVIGHSAQGRQIKVTRLGTYGSPRRVLVVGCIHGNECEGVEITRRLVRGRVRQGIEFWVVHVINPDGRHLGVRQNGRGVDLNRNFGSEWIPIGERWDPEYSGPRPWSEPETRIARELVKRIRPDVSIWYHQPQALVRAWGHSRPLARKYARLAHEPYRSIRWPNGTAPNWQNHRFPDAASFVVELPAGELRDSAGTRHARAVRRLLAPS